MPKRSDRVYYWPSTLRGLTRSHRESVVIEEASTSGSEEASSVCIAVWEFWLGEGTYYDSVVDAMESEHRGPDLMECVLWSCGDGGVVVSPSTSCGGLGQV
jgi:hypothetical protein